MTCYSRMIAAVVRQGLYHKKDQLPTSVLVASLPGNAGTVCTEHMESQISQKENGEYFHGPNFKTKILRLQDHIIPIFSHHSPLKLINVTTDSTSLMYHCKPYLTKNGKRGCTIYGSSTMPLAGSKSMHTQDVPQIHFHLCTQIFSDD